MCNTRFLSKLCWHDIKTWLWDLSNSFIKFIKDWIVILSRCKHKTITNNTFFDDFLSLDNEIELSLREFCNKEALPNIVRVHSGYYESKEKNNHTTRNLPIFPKEMYAFLHILLYLENVITKPPSKSANLVSINSSWSTLLHSAHTNLVIVMVTE